MMRNAVHRFNRGFCHLLRALLCYSLLLPTQLVYADLAEELLGVKKVEPPVRRAIDQIEDNNGAKDGSKSSHLPGVPDYGLSDDQILDIFDLIEAINKQLGQLVKTSDQLASKPASFGDGSGSARVSGFGLGTGAHVGKISHDWGDKKYNPKESMLSVLHSVNVKLAKLFAELGLPSDHEVLKKAKLALARAQQAVNAGVKVHRPKKKERLKPGFLPEPVHGSEAAKEHFKKRTKSAVVDRLHQPKVRVDGLPGSGLAKNLPTEAIKDLSGLPTGDIHPRVDLSKIDNVTMKVKKPLKPAIGLPQHIAKNLDPKINQIDPTINKIDQNISKEVKDLNPKVKRPGVSTPDASALTPKVPDASSLTPSIDTDKIRKEANVSQKIGQVSENVNRDVGDVKEKVAGINENVQENIDQNVADVSKQVDGIEKKVEQQVSGIKENVEQNVDGIEKQVKESVDESGLKKQIEDQIASKVNPDLEKIRKKVVKATNQAYAGVKKYLNKEINTQKAALTKKYDREYWFAFDYDDDDVTRWFGSEPNNWPNWVGDNSGDLKTYKKYYNGREKVIGDQQTSISSINSLFANTESLLASGKGGPAPAGADDGDPPRSQQELTPGSGHDHRRIQINGNFDETIIAPLQVVAAIGDRSVAIGEFGTIGTEADAVIGSGSQTITVPGVITAAIGYEADAILKIGTVDAEVDGRLSRKVGAGGLIVGAIGGRSDALSNIAVIAGDVKGNAVQNVIVPTSVLASLGADTTATFHVGAVEKGVRVGSLKQNITLYSPTINAAIGYRSKAITTIGNITKDVVGGVEQTIGVGNIINASVGSHTEGKIAIGDINAKVGGNVKQKISIGNILSATVGAGTSNIIDVGVIDAPVTGNVDMNISTGSINAISVGAHTETEAVVGSIRAPVYGNVTSNINTGSITNFAIGIGVGSGTSISARTFVGSVFKPVHGNVNIDVSTGHIFTFGFGIDIDLGPFGELRIVIDGCKGGGTSIGNIGGPC